MATKRKNYAKCKVWGDGVVADIEGSILGCMSSMLMAVPKEYQQKFVDHLQKEVSNLANTSAIERTQDGSSK